MQIFVRPLGDGIAGAYWMVRGTPFMVVNCDESVERQRFTLAHEFGHYRMGHGNRVDATLGWGEADPVEVQANYFAGSFLVPAPAFANALERLGRPEIDFDVIVSLAATFGVSAKAMRVRLETLGAIKGRKIEEFDALIGARKHQTRAAEMAIAPVADTLALAKQRGGRMPPGMEHKVLEGIRHELISEAAAKEILRVDESGLAAIRSSLTVPSE